MFNYQGVLCWFESHASYSFPSGILQPCLSTDKMSPENTTKYHTWLVVDKTPWDDYSQYMKNKCSKPPIFNQQWFGLGGIWSMIYLLWAPYLEYWRSWRTNDISRPTTWFTWVVNSQGCVADTAHWSITELFGPIFQLLEAIKIIAIPSVRVIQHHHIIPML